MQSDKPYTFTFSLAYKDGATISLTEKQEKLEDLRRRFDVFYLACSNHHPDNISTVNSGDENMVKCGCL